MTEEIRRRPKEQIYKSRMRLHVMATVTVIVLLTPIWPLFLYPYMAERIGMTVGYHHGRIIVKRMKLPFLFGSI